MASQVAINNLSWNLTKIYDGLIPNDQSQIQKQLKTSQEKVLKLDGQTQNKKARWKTNTASVYIAIKNDTKLRQAALDAISAWNQTGAFVFKLTNNQKHAQIVITTMNSSDTQAAGQTSTQFYEKTNFLYHAKVQLNQYYLENPDYNYSQTRITNTAEHELGHAIGLMHTNKVSVMYPAGSYYTIQPRDIANVKKLYQEK